MDKCIFVVMEAVDGSVKNVGFEMITPAKEIAAAKGLKTVAVLVGNDVAEAAKLAGEIKRASGMLANPKFVDKAPAAKVEEEKAKLAKYTEMSEQVAERLAQLKK